MPRISTPGSPLAAPLWLALAACHAGAGAAPDVDPDPDPAFDAATGTDAAGPAGDALATPGFATWPRDAVLYHAYVRSFADSNGDGNGDLAGMTARLDYVHDLGVDGILLLPIFQDAYPISGGYGTTDYGHVATDYGGDAAFASFLAAAHARGLKVVLDLSFTLVADQHPWFVAAQASPQAAERAHFLTTSGPPCPSLTDSLGNNGWHPFAQGRCFFSDYAATFPSLDPRDAATAEAMRSAAVHWLGLGVDGFRLDSAASIAQVDPAHPTAAKDPSSPATHAFWRAFMQRIKQTSPQVFAVAELFDHEADYYADGIDMTFQYQIYFGLVDAWQHASTTLLGFVIDQQLAARPPGAFGGVFLGNHDVPGTVVAPGGRVADLVCPLPCSDPGPLRAAAMLLLALPGTPFIYYGEELGLHGAASADPAASLPWSRNPMPWDATAQHGFTTAGAPWAPYAADPAANVAAQNHQPGSLLETYKGLLAVRKTSPALRHGGYRAVPTSRPDVLAFVREDPAERVLVVASFAAATNPSPTVTLDLAALGITQATAHERLFGSALPAVTPGNAAAYPIALPSKATTWILLQ